MNAYDPPLLPSGFYDLLPADARKESATMARLFALFESFGYAQVSPPLMEFEASLLSGRGEALGSQTFRVMDPLSQTMMGFRADITLQIARIATTRMEAAARPLRLCYAGAILQTRPEPLKHERQLLQAGIELIGTDSMEADAEAMIVAATALAHLGIGDISIDVSLPGLLRELCPEAQADAGLRDAVREAVARKDADALARLDLASSEALAALVQCAGPVEKALKSAAARHIPDAQRVQGVAQRVRRHCPDVALTLDPLEYAGFDYHSGIGFSLFAKAARQELGRGGRYLAGSESATGFTLYVTHFLPLLAPVEEKKRVLVPQGENPLEAANLRTKGWAAILALGSDAADEARRLACTHILKNGNVVKL